MLAEKKPLGVEELEAQTALELPDREMMALVTVVAADVVDVRNVDVAAAANVCLNNVNVGVGQADVGQTASQQCSANAS